MTWKRLPTPYHLRDGLQADGSYYETDRDFGPCSDGRWYVTITPAGRLTVLVSPRFRPGDCDVWAEADGVRIDQANAIHRAVDEAFDAYINTGRDGDALVILRARLRAIGVVVEEGEG